MSIADLKYNRPYEFGEVFTHDELVFEGINRPTNVLSFHDVSGENALVLRQYFTDLQNLFMKKLLAFATEDRVSSVETVKLRSLLDEMIEVKGLIERSTK